MRKRRNRGTGVGSDLIKASKQIGVKEINSFPLVSSNSFTPLYKCTI